MKRLLLGIGNRLSHDDGVGSIVAERMSACTGWAAVDCGTAVENAAGIVTREQPDLLVLVDAAQMGLPPGSIRRLSTGANDRMLASTHGLPLSFLLARIGAAVPRVQLIGIQPMDLTLGDGLSLEVDQAATRLVFLLQEDALDQLDGFGED